MGIPMHERSCRQAKTWFALPEDTPAWARKLAESLDVSPPGRSPAVYEDRQTARGLHWLTHALWHASLKPALRFDQR